METLFVLALAAVSSTLAAWLGTRLLRLPSGTLATAARQLLEFVGLWVLCLGLNVVLGIGAVLLVRAWTSVFISAYIVNDLALVVISALQAFLLQAWMSSSRP